MPTVILSRPEHDYITRYCSRWTDEIKKLSEDKGFTTIDLWRDKAERVGFEGRVKKSRPAFVVINGHGDDMRVCGHDNQIILDQNSIHLLKGSIIFARSCETARGLGPLAISRGVRAFVGYKESFALMRTQDKRTRPLQDSKADLFIGPSNKIPMALLKGHTTGEAVNISRETYLKVIKKLYISGPAAYSDAIPYLLWNMQATVCVGDSGAKI